MVPASGIAGASPSPRHSVQLPNRAWRHWLKGIAPVANNSNGAARTLPLPAHEIRTAIRVAEGVRVGLATLASLHV
eukprot:695051-Rhodomonas_salina.1